MDKKSSGDSPLDQLSAQWKLRKSSSLTFCSKVLRCSLEKNANTNFLVSQCSIIYELNVVYRSSTCAPTAAYTNGTKWESVMLLTIFNP